jgi:LysM repeat protein
MSALGPAAEAPRASFPSGGPGPSQYQIQRGDTLGEIARASGTPIERIMEMNRIADPNKIQAGASLSLPHFLPRSAMEEVLSQRAPRVDIGPAVIESEGPAPSLPPLVPQAVQPGFAADPRAAAELSTTGMAPLGEMPPPPPPPPPPPGLGAPGGIMASPGAEAAVDQEMLRALLMQAVQSGRLPSILPPPTGPQPPVEFAHAPLRGGIPQTVPEFAHSPLRSVVDPRQLQSQSILDMLLSRK